MTSKLRMHVAIWAGVLVMLVGVGLAWDSPLTPFDDLELVYVAVLVPVAAVIGTIGWRWRGFWGLLLTVPWVAAAGPYVVLGLWVVNGAGVETPSHEARCVIVAVDRAPPLRNRRDKELFECDTAWGKLSSMQTVAINAVARAVGTTKHVRLRRGRLGWAFVDHGRP